MLTPTENPVYLDSNSGAPLHRSVVEELQTFFSSQNTSLFSSNPSSIHQHGRKANKHLFNAREQVARSLGAQSGDLTFTSSGTEANQQVIRSALESYRGDQPFHWITTAVEHDSILKMIPWVKAQGGKVTVIGVRPDGSFDLEQWREALSSDAERPNLVSIVWVNNETGVISPIQELGQLIVELSPGCQLHVDGAQAWGKLPIDVGQLSADYLTLSGHKIGALPGIGVLWTRDPSRLEALVKGNQQARKRGGTENLVGLISLGVAAAQVRPELWRDKMLPLAQYLTERMQARGIEFQINGDGSDRLIGTLNLSFAGIETDGLVAALDIAGYSVSAGSACSSGTTQPSHVLLAMGRTEPQAKSAIRVSLHSGLELAELDGFVDALGVAVNRLKKYP